MVNRPSVNLGRNTGFLVCALCLSSMLAATPSAQIPTTAEVEEVFVYLAVRTNRVPGQSDAACNDAGFAVRQRNDTELRTLSLATATGKVAREIGDVIGTTVGCFGDGSESGITPFFSRLTINGITAIGRGQCRRQYSDFPEARVGVQDCWLKLENLPDGYVGGFLTSNTLATRAANPVAAANCEGGPCGRGLDSDPPGYGLPALSTLRLWKTR